MSFFSSVSTSNSANSTTKSSNQTSRRDTHFGERFDVDRPLRSRVDDQLADVSLRQAEARNFLDQLALLGCRLERRHAVRVHAAQAIAPRVGLFIERVLVVAGTA